MAAKFVLKKGSTGKFRFNLVATNDQGTMRSPMGRSEPGWAALGPQLGGTWGTVGDSEPGGQRPFGAIGLGWKPLE
jgi:hypothetical protein